MYATVHKEFLERRGTNFRSFGPTAAFDVVAVTASAGGIPALKAVLATLPADFPAAIVVAQHLPPAARYRSSLDIVLQRATLLQVKWAEEGECLQPGVVFLSPQDRHLCFGDDVILHLSDGPKINGFRPAADPLFACVAAHFGARSIAVVLSGTLSDGARGAWDIARRGGRVLVQDYITAQFPDMPRAASQAAGADFTFAPVTLGHVLISLVMVPGAAEWFRVPRSIRTPEWATFR